MTTQYLQEADALSDRIIMTDSGSIIAEGTVDELKKRTGSDYCEIVPKDPADLPAIATALTPMLPDEARARWALHPVQRRGADERLKREARFQAGRFEVPARSAAVFVLD